MSDSPPAWPGMAESPVENVTFTPERGIWGKAHSVDTDYRWLGRTAGLAEVERTLGRGLSTDLHMGAEDDPGVALAWRPLAPGVYMAARIYGSRARDSSDRQAVLEKQFRVATLANPFLAAATLLPGVALLDSSEWWERRQDPRWPQREFYLSLPPDDPIRVDSCVAASLAERGREYWSKGELGPVRLAQVVAAIRGGQQGVFLTGVPTAIDAAAVVTLLAGLTTLEASRVSVLGGLFSSRTRATSLDWTVVCCVSAPPDAARQPEPPAGAVEAAAAFLAGDSGALAAIAGAANLATSRPRTGQMAGSIRNEQKWELLDVGSWQQIEAELRTLRGRPGFREALLARLPGLLNRGAPPNGWETYQALVDGIRRVLGWAGPDDAQGLLAEEGWRCFGLPQMGRWVDAKRGTTLKVLTACGVTTEASASAAARRRWLAALLDAEFVIDRASGNLLLLGSSELVRSMVVDVLKAGGMWAAEVREFDPAIYEPLPHSDSSYAALFPAVDNAVARRAARLRTVGPSVGLLNLESAQERFRSRVAVVAAREPQVVPYPVRVPVFYYLWRLAPDTLAWAFDELSPARVSELIETTRQQLAANYPSDTRDVREGLKRWYRTPGAHAFHNVLADALQRWGIDPDWLRTFRWSPPAQPDQPIAPPLATAILETPPSMKAEPLGLSPVDFPAAGAVGPEVAPQPVRSPSAAPPRSSEKLPKKWGNTWGGSSKSLPPAGATTSEEVESDEITAPPPSPPVYDAVPGSDGGISESMDIDIAETGGNPSTTETSEPVVAPVPAVESVAESALLPSEGVTAEEHREDIVRDGPGTTRGRTPWELPPFENVPGADVPDRLSREATRAVSELITQFLSIGRPPTAEERQRLLDQCLGAVVVPRWLGPALAELFKT